MSHESNLKVDPSEMADKPTHLEHSNMPPTHSYIATGLTLVLNISDQPFKNQIPITFLNAIRLTKQATLQMSAGGP